MWSTLPGAERGKYLYRIARIVQERARELAVLESLDNGKPIRESRDVDVPILAAHFFYYAGWADKLDWAGLGPDPRALGVAGQVIPWNFPLLMLALEDRSRPSPPATPSCSSRPRPLRSRRCCSPRSASRPTSRRASSTSSPAPATPARPWSSTRASTRSRSPAPPRWANRSPGRSPAPAKRVTLELGGKAANIVFDDAPIDQAIEGIVNGIFFNQGHVCCAGSRLLVQESVADEVLDSLKRRLATLRMGDPLDKNTDVGAINSAEQLERIRSLAGVGEAEGAQRWSVPCELPDRGFWFPPTLFTGVTQAHRIAREEIFGPVLSVLTFRTPAEAVAKANNTPYGLSAGVWTEKGSRILWMADRAACRVSCGRTRSTGSTRPRRSAATRSPATAARAGATA